jgi:hypothetical protein
MKRKVITLPKNLNVSVFVDRARQIQTSLNSGLFNTIVPTPVEVNAKLDELQALQAEMNVRNYQNRDIRDAVRKEIEAMLSSQCTYVNAISNGNLPTLKASGFELNKEREQRPVPSKGLTPTYSNTGTGSVIITTKGIHNHDFVELEIDGPNGLCNHYSGLYAKFKVADLPTGVMLRACMRGINSHGPGEWSDSLTFIVLASAQHGDAA